MNTKLIMAGVSIISAAAGAAAGFFLARKKLDAKYEARYAMELAQAKHHYRLANKIGEYATPGGTLAQRWPGATIPEGLDPDEEEAGREHTAGAINRVVDEIIDNNQYASPAAARMHLRRQQPRPPYVISEEEYHAGEAGYTQVSLTWFPNGEVLLDEADDELDDLTIVGRENLDQFGEASKENTLHVRNDILQVDYEIVLDLRHYAEVIGLQD